MNNLIVMLTFVSLVFGIMGLGGFYGIYKNFIKPKRTKTKLENLLPLIQEWFDELDCNLDKDINISALHNKERKIHEYIEKYLKHYTIKPNKKLIRKWNEKMGIKKEMQGSEKIFYKFSRIPAEGMDIDLFFTMIVGNFDRFYKDYINKREEYNFAEVEMPIKFLKFYVAEL